MQSIGRHEIAVWSLIVIASVIATVWLSMAAVRAQNKVIIERSDGTRDLIELRTAERQKQIDDVGKAVKETNALIEKKFSELYRDARIGRTGR